MALTCNILVVLVLMRVFYLRCALRSAARRTPGLQRLQSRSSVSCNARHLLRWVSLLGAV